MACPISSAMIKQPTLCIAKSAAKTRLGRLRIKKQCYESTSLSAQPVAAALPAPGWGWADNKAAEAVVCPLGWQEAVLDSTCRMLAAFSYGEFPSVHILFIMSPVFSSCFGTVCSHTDRSIDHNLYPGFWQMRCHVYAFAPAATMIIVFKIWLTFDLVEIQCYLALSRHIFV